MGTLSFQGGGSLGGYNSQLHEFDHANFGSFSLECDSQKATS